MDVHYRLAKPNDARALAALHRAAALEQRSGSSGGFLGDLGEAYLRQYYRIFLAEAGSVILCAVDSDGRIVGVVSGSLVGDEHRRALLSHRFRLFISLLPALIKDPNLLRPIIRRKRSLTFSESSYISLEGPREEYWGWDPSRRSAASLELQAKWIALVKLLGAETVWFEIDEDNTAVLALRKRMGGEVVRKFTTPDGTVRLLMKDDLTGRP